MNRRVVTTGVRGFGPLPQLVREQAGEAALERLFADVEVPVALLASPDARVPLTDMVTIFDRAARLLGEPLLGLRIGRGMQPEDYGTWARYAVAGPTLRHGLRRLCHAIRYYQTADSMNGSIHGDLVRIAYHQLGVEGLAAGQHADHVLYPLLTFMRRFLGPTWLPLWFEVPYSRTEAAKDLPDLLGADVHFDGPGLGLVFDRGVIDAPGKGTAPSFAEIRGLVRSRRDSEFATALGEVIELRLVDGQVAIDGAATRLGLQKRTLQRRLQAEGISYRQIVDTARRMRAEQALASTGLPIVEIAASLGYDEPAHFSRAFRRWHGCSPSDWRRARAA